MKVDFFPAESFAARQLDRRRALRAGGETSQRQWRDVVGILKAAAGSLERSYLRSAARERSVDDLLDRALGDAGLNRR